MSLKHLFKSLDIISSQRVSLYLALGGDNRMQVDGQPHHPGEKSRTNMQPSFFCTLQCASDDMPNLCELRIGVLEKNGYTMDVRMPCFLISPCSAMANERTPNFDVE